MAPAQKLPLLFKTLLHYPHMILANILIELG